MLGAVLRSYRPSHFARKPWLHGGDDIPTLRLGRAWTQGRALILYPLLRQPQDERGEGRVDHKLPKQHLFSGQWTENAKIEGLTGHITGTVFVLLEPKPSTSVRI